MGHLIATHAAARPDEVALVDPDGSTTWSQLDERVNRLLNALRARGVTAGSVIAAMLPNSREYYEVFMAAQHGGILIVPVNWHWVGEELAYVLENSDSVALVAGASFGPVALSAVAAQPVATRIAVGGPIEGFEDYEAVLAGAPADEPEGQAAGGPMFYTSGTTGRPKGVRGSLSGGTTTPIEALEFLGAVFPPAFGLPADGVTLLDGPLYHSAQWAFSMLPLIGGARVVIRPRFDPGSTLRAIDEHRVTNIHLVPTQLVRLLRLPDDVRASFRGDSLIQVLHGAAPCPPDVKRRMIEWWGEKITEYYGATEGSVVSMASSAEWLARPGTVGKPIMGKEVIIVDDDGNRLGVGEAGTIYVRDPTGQDFQYHKDEEKTARAHMAPGVITLGDIGYLDDDGYLYLSDRKIDMIISGGVNIYPAEIEGVLSHHPAVRDVAVFGVPNDEFGEEVKAAVELADGYVASPDLAEELIGHCRAHLAGYKAPKSIDFEDALPRQPTGKLYKRLLRDRYWEGRGRAI